MMAEKAAEKKAPAKKTAEKKETAVKKPAEKKAPAKTAAKKAPAAKKPAAESVKAAETAAPEKKAPVKKAAAAKKTAEKKSAKKPALVIRTILQVGGKEYDISGMAEKAYKGYKSVHKRKEVTEFVLYVKPEGNAAYFTVNGIGGDEDKLPLDEISE